MLPLAKLTNKILAEMTKHTFPVYAFREQKRYLRRHQLKPRSMKLHSLISRLQKLNAYLEEELQLYLQMKS